MTSDSGREGGGGNGPADVTAKASLADSRSATHGSLSGVVGRVASASALAQLVGQSVSFVQTIGLARLLTPTDVGIFAAGTVLTALFTNLVEGGLRAGLVQRQRDLADADETVFWVTLMFGAAASLGCLAAAPVIGIIFNSHTVGLVAAATSGLLLIHSLTNVPESVLQREFSVKRRLFVGPAIAVSYAVVAVGLAALGWGVWSMVAGVYASYIAGLASLWVLTSWRPGRGHASFAMWRELARFGFPLVFSNIGYRLRTAVEALVVGRVLSTGALGFFRYGERIAQIPQTGIIEVGATTLFPAFSRIAGDSKRLAAAYLRALHWSMVGAAAGTGLIIAAGEPAVVVLFGEKWRGAGVALVYMSGLNIGSGMSVCCAGRDEGSREDPSDHLVHPGRPVLRRGFPAGSYPAVRVRGRLAIHLPDLPGRRRHHARSVPDGGDRPAPQGPESSGDAAAEPGHRNRSRVVAGTRRTTLRYSRADSCAVLLAVDALVFCLVYLAVLAVFARPTVVTIVRKVPVLIARFRRGAAESGPRGRRGWHRAHKGARVRHPRIPAVPAGHPAQVGDDRRELDRG